MRALHYFLCIYYTIKSSVFQYPRQKFLWIFWTNSPLFPSVKMSNYIRNKLIYIDNTQYYHETHWHKSMKISIFFDKKIFYRNEISNQKLSRDNFCRESSCLSPLPLLVFKQHVATYPSYRSNRSRDQEHKATSPPNSAAATRRKPKIASMRNGDDCFCNHRRCDSKRYFRVSPKKIKKYNVNKDIASQLSYVVRECASISYAHLLIKLSGSSVLPLIRAYYSSA